MKKLDLYKNKKLFSFFFTAIAGSIGLSILSLIFSDPAEAVILNVGGQDYRVGTFNGSYNDNVSRFSLAEMPWWGNQSIAQQFSTALGGSPWQALPSNPNDGWGPFFAYNSVPGDALVISTSSSGVEANIPVFAGSLSNYAIAIPILAPVGSVIVNVGGQDYRVSIFNGSYNDNSSLFATAQMPWWGNQSIAQQFAEALGTVPWGGLPDNGFGNFGFWEPFFAYDSSPGDAFVMSVGSSGSGANIPASSNLSYNYAVAAPIPAPVPFEGNSLPMLGASLFMAGGIWWKRKHSRLGNSD
jgi:hypothetical protein